MTPNPCCRTKSLLRASESSSESSPSHRLDALLAQGTTAFPLFVVGAAILGTVRPSTLNWVNKSPNLISNLLAAVMCGTGLTLTAQDFAGIRQQKAATVPLGLACQFGIMPVAAAIVGTLLRNFSGLPLETSQALVLGLILVGCSPGGTASNLVALIARADVALSVVLTTCSTMLAVVATPVLVQLLLKLSGTIAASTTISVSGWALVQATARVVLAPVLVGMAVKARAPRLADFVSRFTPFASVLLVSLICGGVVAQNAPLLRMSGNGSVLLPAVVLSVLALHSIGFLAGYVIPRKLTRQFLGADDATSRQTARTIAIETGMQNSALSVVLARSIPGAPLIASLPGALSATVHSCLGSGLAAAWRWQDARRQSANEPRTPGAPPAVPDEEDFMI